MAIYKRNGFEIKRICSVARSTWHWKNFNTYGVIICPI